MSRNEEIVGAAAANLALEGMYVSAREKRVAMDCLSGKRSFNDAVSEIIKRHKKV